LRSGCSRHCLERHEHPRLARGADRPNLRIVRRFFGGLPACGDIIPIPGSCSPDFRYTWLALFLPSGCSGVAAARVPWPSCCGWIAARHRRRFVLHLHLHTSYSCSAIGSFCMRLPSSPMKGRRGFNFCGPDRLRYREMRGSFSRSPCKARHEYSISSGGPLHLWEQQITLVWKCGQLHAKVAAHVWNLRCYRN